MTIWFWDPMSNIIVTQLLIYCCLRHSKTQFQSFQPDGNLARLQMVRLQPIICVNILLGSIEILLTNGHLLETHSRTSGLPEVMGTRGLVPTIHFMTGYLNTRQNSFYKWTKISSLEINIFDLKIMVKSGLEFFIFKFSEPLSAILSRFVYTGQQQL